VLANDVKYLGIAATIYLAVIGFAWLDPKIDPGRYPSGDPYGIDERQLFLTALVCLPSSHSG
jgi:hypothetical protein